MGGKLNLINQSVLNNQEVIIISVINISGEEVLSLKQDLIWDLGALERTLITTLYCPL